MPYAAALATRVRAVLDARVTARELRMFGGIAWTLDGNMACAVLGDELGVRLGNEGAEAALAEPGTRPFEMKGRGSRSSVLVAPEALADDAALASWVERGVACARALPPK